MTYSKTNDILKRDENTKKHFFLKQFNSCINKGINKHNKRKETNTELETKTLEHSKN